MAKYRKKPVVIDAIRWDGNLSSLAELGATINEVSQELLENSVQIRTLEGEMTANVGDWIIKGVKGELYPCKPDIFAATYDQV